MDASRDVVGLIFLLLGVVAVGYWGDKLLTWLNEPNDQHEGKVPEDVQ